MSSPIEPLKNYVLLGMAGVEIRPVKVMTERYQYVPESRTLLLNGEMYLEEACAICEDLFAELVDHWEPISN